MVLTWPGSLAALAVVAAVAAWALFRPGRQLAVVGSLSLWRKALDSLDRSARRRSRRASASWAMLLAGATAGVLALARPVYYSRRPARRIAIAVQPAAELAGSGGREAMTSAVEALLDRLAQGDQVRLLRPAALGGASDWLSPAEARMLVRELPILPAAARDLDLPPADPDAQHTVRFVVADCPAPPAAGTTTVELPPATPAVTVEAFGAADVGEDRTQVFFSLRNRTPAGWRGEVALRRLPRAGDSSGWAEVVLGDVVIGPGREARLVRELPPATALAVEAKSAGDGLGAEAFLARSAERRCRVALVGADEPLLRRFIRADAMLEPVARSDQADVVFANSAVGPPDKPALEIDPPVDPPGWRRGQQAAAVVLSGLTVAGDDPVMRGVNLDSVAVRRLRPWVRTDQGGGYGAYGKVLAGAANQAVILRSDPGAAVRAGPARIHVAFDLGADNTNMAMSEAFVVLLANAVRWLTSPLGVPAGAGSSVAQADWVALTPAQAVGHNGWTPLPGGARRTQPDARSGPLPWPGLYRDEAGRIQAVSVLGLSGGIPSREARQAASDLPLPGPLPAAGAVELWPVLAACALAFWLAGWALRMRGP